MSEPRPIPITDYVRETKPGSRGILLSRRMRFEPTLSLPQTKMPPRFVLMTIASPMSTTATPAPRKPRSTTSTPRTPAPAPVTPNIASSNASTAPTPTPTTTAVTGSAGSGLSRTDLQRPQTMSTMARTCLAKCRPSTGVWCQRRLTSSALEVRSIGALHRQRVQVTPAQHRE